MWFRLFLVLVSILLNIQLISLRAETSPLCDPAAIDQYRSRLAHNPAGLLDFATAFEEEQQSDLEREQWEVVTWRMSSDGMMNCPIPCVHASGVFNELSRQRGWMGQIGALLKRVTGGPDHQKLLFRDGPPQLHDIQQDLSTNCWFLAALGSVLSTCDGSKRIEEMFYDDGHGTVYIRLYDAQGRQQILALDKERESSLFSVQSKYTSRSKLWVHLLERAFNEMNPHLIQVGKKGSAENAFPFFLGQEVWQTIVQRADLEMMPRDLILKNQQDLIKALPRKVFLQQGFPAVLELLSGSVPHFSAIRSSTVTGQLPWVKHAYAVVSPVQKNDEGIEGVWLRSFFSSVMKIGLQLKDSFQSFGLSRLTEIGREEMFFLPLNELEYWKLTIALPRDRVEDLQKEL